MIQPNTTTPSRSVVSGVLTRHSLLERTVRTPVRTAAYQSTLSINGFVAQRLFILAMVSASCWATAGVWLCLTARHMSGPWGFAARLKSGPWGFAVFHRRFPESTRAETKPVEILTIETGKWLGSMRLRAHAAQKNLALFRTILFFSIASLSR